MCLFHKWGKWSLPYNVAPIIANTSPWISQQRTCERCGQMEARSIGKAPKDGIEAVEYPGVTNAE